MNSQETAENAQMATPHKQLIDELLDSRIPKSEREHAAAREIERLRQELVKPKQEPVAYVTGYFDGKCVIKPVNPVVLLPVGMALYRSPQHQSEDALDMVEPVAYCTLEQLAHLKLTVPSDDKIPLYTAPPKREPMTEQQLDDMFDQAEIAIYIADRQRAEHLEVYSFGVRDAEKWHGIGGEMVEPEATSQEFRQVEPVAVVTNESGNKEVTMSWWHEPALPVGTSLYTSPPKRKPLTDDELIKMWQAINHGKIGHTIDFARAIERAHGIGGEE